MNLLIDKCVTHNSWYEGLKLLKNKYKSIAKVDFFDTTSSAGDWTGYILQKIGNAYYGILVFQENQYPSAGYKTYTDSSPTYVFYTKYVDIELSEIWDILTGFVYDQFPLKILRRMWELFGDVPIDAEENIDNSFLLWKEGTNRIDIWHWFDEMCPNGLAEDIINYKKEK